MSRVVGDPQKGFALHGAGVPRISQYRDFRYTAPELIQQSILTPTPSTDVFAFFSLALDALRPFRNSPSHPRLATLDARIRWLKDYYSVIRNRPSADALYTLLIEEKIPNEARNYDELFDEFLLKKKAHPGSYTGSLQKVSTLIRRYPETSFAVGSASNTVRIHELLKLDYQTSLPYSWDRDKLKRVKKFNMSHDADDYITSFPPEIDRKWMNSLHRTFFGVVMDDNHNLRNSEQDYDEYQLEQKQLYEESIMFSNEARKTLLEENEFFSTRGVINELGRAGLRLQRDEVITLRRWGALLAIPDHDRWLYPRFQFQDGNLSPFILLAHERAIERTGMDPSAWTQLTFFSVPRHYLGDHALREVIWSARWQQRAEEVISNARL